MVGLLGFAWIIVILAVQKEQLERRCRTLENGRRQIVQVVALASKQYGKTFCVEGERSCERADALRQALVSMLFFQLSSTLQVFDPDCDSKKLWEETMARADIEAVL